TKCIIKIKTRDDLLDYHVFHHIIIKATSIIDNRKELTTYIIAFIYCFSNINVSVSLPNVENVVYAPENPTPMMNHNASVIISLSYNLKTRANRIAPLMLASQVPVICLFNSFASQYRAILPKNPPILIYNK